jgi:hypothetical protein
MIFKQFRRADIKDKNIAEGFYEIVYDHNVSFLIKHESLYYVREGITNYKYSPKYLVSTGGPYQRIKSKTTLLKIFGSDSENIKKYLHTNGIRLGKADRAQMIEIIEYCVKLSETSKTSK